MTQKKERDRTGMEANNSTVKADSHILKLLDDPGFEVLRLVF